MTGIAALLAQFKAITNPNDPVSIETQLMIELFNIMNGVPSVLIEDMLTRAQADGNTEAETFLTNIKNGSLAAIAVTTSPTKFTPTWSISGGNIEKSWGQWWWNGKFWEVEAHVTIKLNVTAGAGMLIEMTLPTIGTPLLIDGLDTQWESNTIDTSSHGQLPLLGKGSQFRPGIGWKPYLDVAYSANNKIKFNHTDGYLLDSELVSNDTHYASIRFTARIPIQGR